MLSLAFVFLVLALVAYFLGAGHVGAVAVNIAYVCFAVFIVLLLFSFLAGGSWGWGWGGGPRIVP